MMLENRRFPQNPNEPCVSQFESEPTSKKENVLHKGYRENVVVHGLPPQASLVTVHYLSAMLPTDLEAIF